ncbi:hypothetical protein M378DRAFT_173022, partial [Amanita muscaria Koide BX008]
MGSMGSSETYTFISNYPRYLNLRSLKSSRKNYLTDGDVYLGEFGNDVVTTFRATASWNKARALD